MSPATAGRRRVLRRLITTGTVSSQQELVAALASAGHQVTQATVSRDLDAIGAEKQRTGDGLARYVIVNDVPLDEAQQAVARAIADFVESITSSENIVVLKTPPGAAHLVASAIDRAGLEGVLGTVAGDDTLLCVAASSVGGADLVRTLEDMGARR